MLFVLLALYVFWGLKKKNHNRIFYLSIYELADTSNYFVLLKQHQINLQNVAVGSVQNVIWEKHI